jgi:ribosome-binding factor A
MRGFRKERVASLVHELVSEAIARRLNDPRIDALTTVTRVEIAGDLEVARIYLTVPGGEAAERRTLRAIRHAGGFLQRIVAAELTMRQCPELRFDIDKALKLAKETMARLEENRRNQPHLFESPDDVAEDVADEQTDSEYSVSDEGDAEAPESPGHDPSHTNRRESQE